MTVTPSSPVVGIFKDHSMAEQAIDALHVAGFTSEQVRSSVPGTSGSILTDLKNLFTGQNTNNGSITNDLTDMGLSDEEAQYYSNEYNNGNTILAVSASGREQDALNILHQYGAYNARTSDSSPVTTSSQQPSDSDQQAAYAPDQAPLQQTTTPEWATQQRITDVEDVPGYYNQQDASTSTPSNTEAQNSLPDSSSSARNLEEEPTQLLTSTYSTSQVPSSDDATLAYQPTSSDSVSNDTLPTSSDFVVSDANSTSETIPSASIAPDDTTSENQTMPSDTATSDAIFEAQSSQADIISSGTRTPDFILVSQDAQSGITPTDTITSDPTSVPQSDAAPSDTITSDPTSVSQFDDTPSDITTSDPTSVPQSSDTPSDTSTSDAVTYGDSTLEPPAIPSDDVSDDTSYASQAPISDTETVSSPLQPQSPFATTASEHEDELQQIQEQLQAAQQQLEDARVQLQAAKEHESQIQTIRERERQLQDARQQLQDIQAQLQATLAELHETRSRISEY